MKTATSFLSKSLLQRPPAALSTAISMAKRRNLSTLTSPNGDIALKGLGLRNYPDKALRLPNRLVTHIDEHFHQFLTILMNRMRQEEGVGLAAPQIGANVRVIAFNVQSEESHFQDSDFIPYPLDLDQKLVKGNPWLERLPQVEEELAKQTLEVQLTYAEGLPEFPLVREGDIVMINPRIVRRSEEKIITMPEACLSFDSLFGRVPRHAWVEVAYTPINKKAAASSETSSVTAPYSLNPSEEVIRFTGIKSVVFQHEYDHLQGVLFIDRVIEEDRDSTFKRNMKRLITCYSGTDPMP